MLSKTEAHQLLDQGLKAISALDRQESNTIDAPHERALTVAGSEVEHYQDLGLDVIRIYERETEFGSKSLLYSFSDNMIVVVYYNEFIDRFTYRGFESTNIETAIMTYMEDH